jgi:S-adenosylmethionine-diacylglycerol 3-amino-3-carboxypropyl transferase
MEALAITPESRIVTIASGGCNVLSYLTAGPARITAVDLNTAHVALNRLKLAAAQHLPDHAHFRRFFGEADTPANLEAYTAYVRPYLDETSRRYWEGRDLIGRRRIRGFARGIYKQGLLGGFIGLAHMVARLYRIDPRELLEAETIEQQRAIFDRRFAPIFDKKFVRWLTDQPASLFGLGIPPAQYYALGGDDPDGMASVLRARLSKLACNFDIRDNYFAWQAFGRGYGKAPDAPVPPYLNEANYRTVVDRVDRVDVRHVNMIDHLRQQTARSLDRYVLLDAQDWMTDGQLGVLWAEITRTARPDARVLFRTAAEQTLLPGRVPPRDPVALALRRGAITRPHAPRSFIDLWRRSPLYVRRLMHAFAATRMDAIYHGQRHIYDLTRKYYLLGRDRLIRELEPPPGGSVLEVGCGTARNLIAAARAWPEARCFGFDISTAVLETARASVRRAAVGGRVRLAAGDATAWDARCLFGEKTFDRIFMSYTLSMIPQWRVAIEQAAAALAPGGQLHIVDFGQQERLPAWWRAALFAWLARFEVTPRAELEAVLRGVAIRRGLRLAFRPLYRGYAWSAVLSA